MVNNQNNYWHKQTGDNPLFADMLWSRPENRLHAGKLLVVGGNAQGFATPAEAFTVATKTGAGRVRVLLPDVLQKSVSRLFPEAEFAPSTPSGSFAKSALGELLPAALSVDSILLAGDIGRNSETAVLLESFLQKYNGPVTITRDVIEYLTQQPTLVNTRPDTLLVLSFSQLQKLVTSLRFPQAVSLDMDMLRTVNLLHSLSGHMPFHIITKHLDTLFVASGGQVSSSSCRVVDRVWRLRVATTASVWWMQNPEKPFEALTTSLVA